MRNSGFVYAKRNAQIRAENLQVTLQLISAFVFTTQIVQSPYFLHIKSQASSNSLWL